MKLPMRLSYTVYLPDGTIKQASTMEGTLEPYEDYSQGVTYRNTAFFLRQGDISVTVEAQ